MVDDNISDSASKRRSRLTLGTCSASSSRHLPLTANIPHFTHPSSQQSIDKTFKPLPRPQKEKQEPKPKPKPKPKPAATSNKISSIISSLPLRPVSGSPKSLTKKLLQRAEAERKKKDGPLEEAEEGFYDDRGFWVDGSAMEEWKLGTTANDMTDADQQHTNADEPAQSQREEERAQDAPMEDYDAAIAQELVNLHNLPASQPREAMFSDHHRPTVKRRPPTPHRFSASGHRSMIGGHSTPTPRMGDTWGKREDGAGRYDTSNLRGNTEGEEPTLNISQQPEPEIPMPPSAQPERRTSVSAPAGRAPPSRLKYTNFSPSDDEEEDMLMGERPAKFKDGVQVHRVTPTDYLCSQDGPESEEEHTRMSPTEMNSSNTREPVPRSSTRRSNSRQRVYSAQSSEPPASPSGGTYQGNGPSHISQSRPDRTSSFPVSDSEVSTQMSVDRPTAPVAKSRRLNTYSKSNSRVLKVTTARRREMVDPENPARQPGFRDQFSPEPEWENQQRKERQNGHSGANPRPKTKRRGSTSIWPASLDGPTYPQPQSPNESEDDEDDEEGEEGEEADGATNREPLREVRVNKQGRILARGRGRNGAWPGQRDLGLFGDEDEDAYRPRPEVDQYRPLTERLHLVHVKEEVMDLDEEPRQHKRRREDDADRIRAFTDPRRTHPIAKLKLTRSDSVRDRVDGYTSKLNSRHRHDRLPYTPGVTKCTNGLPKRSRRRYVAACDDLPSYVLKPIERISIGKYRQELKSRIPHDGFVNPRLLKAGRLAARDELLIKQRRIKSTGTNGRTRGFHNQQTPIVGDDGVVDDIVPPTQTQRDPNHTPDPIDQDQDQDQDEQRHLGFAARHRRIKRSRTTHRLEAGRIGQLQFTTQAHAHTQAQESTSELNQQPNSNGLYFTSRSPPRASTTGQVSFVDDTYEDEQEDYVQPAPDIPELALAQPRVGYISRFKTHKRARVENDEVDELQDDYDDDDDEQDQRHKEESASRAREERRGFIRKVKGFRAPPAEEGGGLVYGDPIQEDHNDGTTSHDQEDERIDHPDDVHQSNDQTDPHQGVAGGAIGAAKKRKTPLFLTGGENLDSTTSNTVSGLSHEHATGRNQSTAAPTNTHTGSGLSGAQLCDDLLTRTSLLSIPILPAKSVREARRDERAKRIMRKHDRHETDPGGADHPSNSHRARAEPSPSAATKGKGKEGQEETEEDAEIGDEIKAYQPIYSQIKARRRIEEEEDEEANGGQGYQPRSSQIRRREGFGLVDPEHSHVTQSTQAGPVWESSTFDQTSLGNSIPLPTEVGVPYELT